MAKIPPKLVLTEFLPYRISVLSNTISRQIADTYEKKFGLTIGQWRVMAVLGEIGPSHATDICRQTAMDKVAVSRAVTGLEKAGHVKKTADAKDGRRAQIGLTPMGQKTYANIVPLALKFEDQLTEAMSTEDLAKLKNMLEKFAIAISPNAPLW